ncbi:MAG: hypothetical protein KA792_04130 [Bacteroidales bacterium]|nr:hypothetical protein [Bacteroidales bacterium]
MKNNPHISPVNYIKSKARALPFYECFINDNWKEKGLASILISKKQPGGNFLFGMYLVDIFCLGIKNTFFNFNLSELKYNEMVGKIKEGADNMIPFNIVTAHNIIYGAVDYAEELGFFPHKDFKITEFILDPDLINDEIDTIEFGFNDKPYFIAGPNDNINLILATLDRNVGKNNYTFIVSDSNVF